jgi:hypothetical protein
MSGRLALKEAFQKPVKGLAAILLPRTGFESSSLCKDEHASITEVRID